MLLRLPWAYMKFLGLVKHEYDLAWSVRQRDTPVLSERFENRLPGPTIYLNNLANKESPNRATKGHYAETPVWTFWFVPP